MCSERSLPVIFQSLLIYVPFLFEDGASILIACVCCWETVFWENIYEHVYECYILSYRCRLLAASFISDSTSKINFLKTFYYREFQTFIKVGRENSMNSH